MNKRKINDKVTIIGAGFVGATIAYAMMNGGTASHIALIDLDKQKLKSEVMDLNHGACFVPSVKVTEGTYDDCADSSVVIITAGTSQKPGETRLDLVKRNVDIFKKIVPEITKRNEDCIIIVVTNPVDVLTLAALKISGLPRNRVIGSGTVLDSARFRFLLSQHCGLSANNIHAYIIGEHGDSEVAAWSNANISGMPIDDCCKQCPHECTGINKEEIFSQVKNSAYTIIDGKGATYYAVGLAVRRIVDAILRNENSVLPVSVYLDGQYGIDGVCLSVPSRVNAQGATEIFQLPLSDEEKEQLINSANVLKKAAEQVGL
jgi:L-lactate dehydrogenase